MNFKEIISEHYPDVAFDVLTTPDPKLGDYSVNLAFAIAKKEGKNPLDIARELAKIFSESEYFEKVEVAPPGFVNFFLKMEFLQEQLEEIYQDVNYGLDDLGKDKKVIVSIRRPILPNPCMSAICARPLSAMLWPMFIKPWGIRLSAGIIWAIGARNLAI